MTNNGITVASNSAGPAGSPSEKFAGLQACLRAIGSRAHLILTPAWNAYLPTGPFIAVLYDFLDYLVINSHDLVMEFDHTLAAETLKFVV